MVSFPRSWALCVRKGLIFSLFLLGALPLGATPPQGGGAFITTQGNQFMLDGQVYKAIGMCNYPYINANYDFTERQLRRAKASGVTLIRAGMDFFTSGYTGVWNNEAYWKKVDWLLAVASELDMHVALDTSGFAVSLRNSLGVDYVAPANYPYWEAMVDFMTARVNTFTGVAYKDDPTIFQYLIFGETVPYGYNGDPATESRNVNDIENLILHVAARLRQDDPHHLISAGGMLHMSVPVDQYGVQYWQTIWADSNIDCGAIHIYLSDYTVFPSGSWSNLATYKSYCDSISKPLVMEEFGLSLYENSTTVADNYFNNVYDLNHSLGIPVVITWAWGPVGGFSLFPHHTDSLVSIVGQNAVRWGYEGPIYTYEDPAFQTTLSLCDFEGTVDGFSSTGYGGNNGAPAASTVRSTHGSTSLRVPVSFTSTGWNFAGVTRYFTPSKDWSGEVKVACDVWVPEDARALQIKFILYNNWAAYAQNGGVANNWLDPGRWNTVYANLTPESIDWPTNPATGFNKVNQLTLEIHHAYGSPTVTGDVYIDHLRLGEFTEVPVELFELRVE